MKAQTQPHTSSTKTELSSAVNYERRFLRFAMVSYILLMTVVLGAYPVAALCLQIMGGGPSMLGFFATMWISCAVIVIVISACLFIASVQYIVLNRPGGTSRIIAIVSAITMGMLIPVVMISLMKLFGY